MRGGRPSEREGTGVPRTDDSPLFHEIGRQSGALGLLGGDDVTLPLLEFWKDSRWNVGGDVEGRVCNVDEGGGETKSQGQTAFYPAEVMVAERCRVEQG